MKFDFQTVVGGQSLSVARDLLRRAESFTRADAARLTGFTEMEAERYLAALVATGFLELQTEGFGQGRHPLFAATQLGISLRKSKKTKRFSRAAADQAIAALMHAVGEVNANPELIASVEEIDLFGSYTRGANDLGDVDVAVALQRRPTETDWVTANQLRAATTGRRMSFIQEITWGEEEVFRALRAASRRLDIRPKQEIIDAGFVMTPLFRASTS
jgi:predicted nucleotidyltransferase